MNMKDMKSIGQRLTSGPKGKSGDGLVDSAAIRELAELLKETGLTEIEIEHNGARLRVSRQSAVAAAPAIAPAPAPAAPTTETAKPKPTNAGGVTSPMVGTVYVAPEPGAQPFLKVGQTVKEGDTLFIVEAMKTMNPILATRGGTVTEICVDDAQPVEFGQILAYIS
ncbi:MAG TPA: acetyl-CoA carboxylase biotin carboxyl carrier protein [Rhizomicrobium sp.]|nr:acetyl-CoA carboxylase biotin carboxyl carrier protein [Rhizomicrobium sp.]